MSGKHMSRILIICTTCLMIAAFVGCAAAAEPPVGIVTPVNAPATPKIEQLALKESVSQYGITWTFEKPARVGQFVTGDWYAVGPVQVVGITPKPAAGRNGSCLNVDVTSGKIGFDDRILFGRYDAKQFRAPPIALKPGDSLLSSISLAKGQKLKPMLWRKGKDQRSPVRTIAILTCLDAPVPADAFRPSYGASKQRIYLARNLKRDLLPRLPREGLVFKCHQGRSDKPFTIDEAARWVQRPWIDLVMDEFSAPAENMPVYGAHLVRAGGMASLLLCLDFTPQEKEKLLVGLTQVGIDFWGLAGRGSRPVTWCALGGHGNGRKWPIIFAGLMLGDADMQHPKKTYPYLKFSEDMQTMFGPSWTGAKVVWAGHVGKKGNPRHRGWGAYEHLPPSQWESDTGEAYRRCCTSNAWVGTALAARILHQEPAWNHDAFFAYTDRWMTEDDTESLKIIKKARGKDYSADWARQGSTWDPFTKDMWAKYRDNLPAASDGKKTPKSTETWK
jgi:hypothetical protein